MLTLRPTGLSSPAYRDWLDYVIVEDGRDVGRLYEDRHSRPELRWFWSVTILRQPEARDHHERSRAKHRPSQSSVLGELVKGTALTRLFPARFL
jgi:hypothetical protein